MSTVKQIFVNLPVKDLNKSIDFFSKTGFSFNPVFTDENATCMILGENIFAMLLVENYFSTFMNKSIADAKSSTEVITALGVGNREEVDTIVDKAVAAGGKEYKEATDYGWMYLRAFEDPDGHLWEFTFVDMNAMPQE